TLRAQRLQDHVTKHMRLGFRLTDLTNIHELLHERLVLRRQTYLVFADNVTTTVTYLNEVETIATNGSAGESRTPAATTWISLTPEVKRRVGVMKSGLQ